MSLRFLVGRSDLDKSNYILNEIRQKIKKSPQGHPIFYIVPDQMTFQQEYALFNDEEIQGSIRAQVVNFSRLSWRIFQETGGATRKFISSVGVQMLLRKIINEKESGWEIFQKSLEKQGFLDELEKMITEFKRYEITPETLSLQLNYLRSYSHKTASETVLIQKLEDLLYIYEQLSNHLQEKYIDREDQLQLLIGKIKDSILLNEAEIYIDGFNRFTPQELSVIEELMKKSKRITVALTVDQTNEVSSELDLFYQTTNTYHLIKNMALDNNIVIEENVDQKTLENRFINRAYFSHLERYFDTRPSPSFEGSVPIQMAEAVHPRAEVEGVAQEIIRLVRDEQYRFRDIAIFIREVDTYHDLIDTVFGDYNIPVFIDEKESMLNHPLIEFIRSLLDVVEGNWRYDSVFRLLKTGFIPKTDDQYPLTNEAIDELENYVLEYGIRSREKWLEDKWKFQRFYGLDRAAKTDEEKETEIKLNAYRKQVTNAIGAFDEQIRGAKTTEQFCEILFILLEKVKIPEHLEQMRIYYDEQGKIEKGREQDQVWEAVVQLIDEMVEVIGQTEISLQSFRAMLEAGFETLKFAHVPPSIDHVIVGTVDHSRFTKVKCAFLLGVNDGTWPMKPPSEGIINDEEREILGDNGVQLADSNRRKLLDDWFNMYIAFTIAKDRLWISYLLSDEDGKTKVPSHLINRINDLFPSLEETILLQDPDELIEAKRFITTPFKTRAALTAQLARKQKGYSMDPVWLHVLNWYIQHHPKHETTYKVLQSLYYQNKTTNLAKDTVKKLYHKQVRTSVSRLESYYRCSFQHYAQYSLQLNERKSYKLEAPDIGQLFHEALKLITNWIHSEGEDFAKISEEDSNKYAQRAVNQLAPVLQHQILSSSNRYKYIQKKLQEVISRATHILSKQARRSGFSPIGIELGFGDGSSRLKPVKIPLPNGYELLLRGRIDRVDQAKNEQGLFLRIIDYKSSSTGLDLVKVYYGLALQMLAYLDVIISQSEDWLGIQAKPAGILYFHVHNAMISKKDKISDDQLFDEIFKKYKMQGLLLSDEEVVRMMDTDLNTGVSDIVPVGIKKNGGFYSYSKIANDETFSSLKNYIHQLVYEAGIDITSGGVHLNPYEDKQGTACTYCPFLSVCQFDPVLEENSYRKLKDMKDEDILAEIKLDEGRDI